LPARPAWWRSAFPAKAKQRTLLGEIVHPKESDPRALAAKKLYQKAQSLP